VKLVPSNKIADGESNWIAVEPSPEFRTNAPLRVSDVNPIIRPKWNTNSDEGREKDGKAEVHGRAKANGVKRLLPCDS
jgi:hypothetical protein